MNVGALLVHVPAALVEQLAAAGCEVIAAVDDPVADLGPALVAGPQVVVVDLAGADALAAIAIVAEERPGTPVLVVSAEPALPPYTAVLDAVRAGAVGYVAGSDPDEITDAARRLAKGGAAFEPGVAEVVLENRGDPGSDHAADVRLTARESDVLRLVVEGLTARQIGSRLSLSPRTVENHVQHLLRKLGLRGRAALVRYAIENGLA